ncbi:hypothetical protein Tco_1145513 [Tanacetum coccineum]
MGSTIKDPLTFNDLMATLIDFSKYVLIRLKIYNLTQDILLGPAYNLLKGMCSSSIELEYHFQECFNALTEKLDWNNPEGDHYLFDLSKPLPLQGHPGYLTVATDYFFNNDLEYLKSSNPERTYTTSITNTKAARYKIEGIEDMTVLEIEFKEPYTPSHKPPGVIYEHLTKQKRVMRADELYKFSNETLKKVRDELHHRIRDFCLEYNKEIPKRKWTAIDKKRSELMVELIDKQMREKKIIHNLKRLVGARELEMDYKLMTHIV